MIVKSQHGVSLVVGRSSSSPRGDRIHPPSVPVEEHRFFGTTLVLETGVPSAATPLSRRMLLLLLMLMLLLLPLLLLLTVPRRLADGLGVDVPSSATTTTTPLRASVSAAAVAGVMLMMVMVVVVVVSERQRGSLPLSSFEGSDAAASPSTTPSDKSG